MPISLPCSTALSDATPLICRRGSGGSDDIHGRDIQWRLRDAGCVLPLHL